MEPHASPDNRPTQRMQIPESADHRLIRLRLPQEATPLTRISHTVKATLLDKVNVEVNFTESPDDGLIRHLELNLTARNKTFREIINFSEPLNAEKLIGIIEHAKNSDVRGFVAHLSRSLISLEHTPLATQDGKLKVLGESINFLWKHRFHPKVILQMFKDLYFIKNSPKCISTEIFDQGKTKNTASYIYKKLAGSYSVALWTAFAVASVVGHQVQTMFASASVGLIATAATDYLIQTGIFLGLWVSSNPKYYFSNPVKIANEEFRPSNVRWQALKQMVSSDFKVCSVIYLGNLAACKALSFIPAFESSITYTSQLINLLMYGTFALKNVVACTKLFKEDFRLDVTARICSEGLPEKIDTAKKHFVRAGRNIGVTGIGYVVFERFMEWGNLMSNGFADYNATLTSAFIGACGFWAISNFSDYKKKLASTLSKNP